jgi:GxxExxY protein
MNLMISPAVSSVMPLKCIDILDEIKGIHQSQLLTHMKLAGVKIGLLINFNVAKLKDGIRRFVL